MKRAHELMRLLAERFPPKVPRNHIIWLGPNNLIVTLYISDELWQDVNIDKEDYDREPLAIVEDIVKLFEKRNSDV